MNETNIQTLEQQFPSVELAYPLAVASYDAVVKRIDALDGRIQTLMTFAVTICLAIPILGRTQNLTLNSFWFICGVMLLGLAIAVSTYARFRGTVGVVNPVNLYQNTLHLPQEQFKIDIINAAAEAYAHNKDVLETRWLFAALATVIFAVALGMLAVWAATAVP